jgi:hypothetical protein
VIGQLQAWTAVSLEKESSSTNVIRMLDIPPSLFRDAGEEKTFLSLPGNEHRLGDIAAL